jgi:hypothetical protein
MNFVQCDEIKGIQQGDNNCWMTAFLGMFIINDEALLWFMMNFLDPALIKTRFTDSNGFSDITRKVIIDLQTNMRKIVLALHQGENIDIETCHELPSIILSRAKGIISSSTIPESVGVQREGYGSYPVMVLQDMFELFRIKEFKVPSFKKGLNIIKKYIVPFDMTRLGTSSTSELTEIATTLKDYNEDYYIMYIDRGIYNLRQDRRISTEVSKDVMINNISYNLVSMQVINRGHVVSVPKCGDHWYMNESNLVEKQKKMVKLNSLNGIPQIVLNKYQVTNPWVDRPEIIDSIHDYNYKRDNVILFYTKPYLSVKDKYEERLTQKYWDMSGETALTIEQKIERKKEINKQIKLVQKQINSLIYDFELVFDPSIENTNNMTRIIAVEKDIENPLPAIRKQMLDTLLNSRKNFIKTTPIEIIKTEEHIDDIKARYDNAIHPFSNVFNINIITNSRTKIENINVLGEELSQLYIKLGEAKTDLIDEQIFLDLLKFINDRVNAKYHATTAPAAAASGYGTSGTALPEIEVDDRMYYNTSWGGGTSNTVVYNLFKK